MSYPSSDLSCSNPPSSPIPGPSNLSRRPFHRPSPSSSNPQTPCDRNELENDPWIARLSSPPISSEPDPWIGSSKLRPSLSSSSTTRRIRSRTGSSGSSLCSSTRRRTYRQATLSECLNRLTSSSLSNCTSTGLAGSLEDDDDQEDEEELIDSSSMINSDLMSDPPHEDYHRQRPRLVPLVLADVHNRQSKRPRMDDGRDNLTNVLLLSSSSGLEPPIELSVTGDELSPQVGVRSHHRSSSSPRPPHRSTMIQTSHDLLDFETGPRRSNFTRATPAPRMMKRIESLSYHPAQTIQMWNPSFDNGFDFPFSLCFNHTAKAGDCGRPPAEGEIMAVASAMGTISLYHPHLVGASENMAPIASIEATRNGIFALSFSPSDLKLATGSGAQVSEIFDVETTELIGSLQGHLGTVKTLEFSPHNEQIIVTGSRDGSIKVWDLRTVGRHAGDDDASSYPAVITIRNAHDEKYAGRKRKKGVRIPSVSSVLWSRHTNHHLFSAGSANSVIKLWDIRKKTPFSSKTHPTPVDQSTDHSSYEFFEEEDQYSHQCHSIPYPQRPHGISSLTCSSDGARIYALGTDSTIRTHDGLYLSRPPESQLRSYQHPMFIGTSLYLKLALSPDDQYLACSSSTGDIFVWDTTNPCYPHLQAGPYDDEDPQTLGSNQPAVLSGHSKEVCGLEFWRQGLGSCSDDSMIKIWSYSDAYLATV